MFMFKDGPVRFLKYYFKLFNVQLELTDLLVDDNL